MPVTRLRPLRSLLRPAMFAVLFASSLAGCGGGDGDSSTEASPLVITSSNAQAVTADALQAAGTAAGSSITAMVLGVPQQAMVMMGTVAIDETRLCYYGGRYYVRGTVASTEALTVGDQITVTADGCRMSSYFVVNGGVGFNVLAGGLASDQDYPYAVTVQVDVLNLSLDQSGYVQTVTGDTRVAASADDSATHSVALSGASLRYSTSAYSYTLKAYEQTIRTFNGNKSNTTTATVITSNPMLGTSVTYKVTTPAALVYDAAGKLVAGSLKVVSGATTLLATVTAPDVLMVQADTNGDGVYDQTQTVLVTDLQGTFY